MNRLSVALFTAGLGALRGLLLAGVVIGAPGGSAFETRVQAELAVLKASDDPLIRRLCAAAIASHADISIRPITDDRSTWHASGDRNRAHTEPADGRPKNAGRDKATNAIIYVPPGVADPGSTHWKDGMLIHELVHALDLATGRYDRDLSVRERRAVFMQNVWRARVGYKLRMTYHGRFRTLDYQEALRRRAVAEVGSYIFTRPYFPPSLSSEAGGFNE